MKKAFTMLELVFVIVVVGILSYVAASSFQRNPLREAADQLVSHIRYTQHLAMMDEKFDTNDSTWYKSRWQLRFSNSSGSNNQWSYTIYSDYLGGHTGNPDPVEVAINPENPNQRLTGGYSGTAIIKYDDPEATKQLNIQKKYGIVDVDFLGGCAIAVNQQRIFFDYLGRPFYGGPHLLDNPYKNGTTNMLINSMCKIELCLSTCTTANTSEKITINIEPETGYTHIQ